MNKNIGNRRSSGSIHEALRLPSTYKVGISLEGYLGRDHFSLRKMDSQTGGTIPAFARAINWGEWVEITRDQFSELAKRIVV